MCSIILAFAAFHIYWAATLPLPFVIYYVCALLIPIFLFAAALAIIKENNQNWTRTKIHQCRCWLASKQKRKGKEKKTSTNDEENPQQQQQPSLSPQPQEHEPMEHNIPSPTNPYTKTLSLHLHHWQIFYMLAFFTRFTHPVSQVGAGIVLACYMEGICACKYLWRPIVFMQAARILNSFSLFVTSDGYDQLVND